MDVLWQLESLWNLTLDRKGDGGLADCSTLALDSMCYFCGNPLYAYDMSTYNKLFPSAFFPTFTLLTC